MNKTDTLIITGMSCQMCVKHVTKALQSVNGVTDVVVHLEQLLSLTIPNLRDYKDSNPPLPKQVMLSQSKTTQE